MPNGPTGIVFHGWDPTYSYRAMYVRTLDWWNGVTPHVRGTATRYEAEDGVVNEPASSPTTPRRPAPRSAAWTTSTAR